MNLLRVIILILIPITGYLEQRKGTIKLITPTKRYILIENGRRTSYYEVKPDHPMKVKIEGPTTIYIEMRLNLDAYSPLIPALVDLVIERDEKTYDVYRVAPSGVAEERYVNIKNLVPSTKTKFRIEVPPGIHFYVISISSGANLGAVLRFTVQKPYPAMRPKKVEKKPIEKRAKVTKVAVIERKTGKKLSISPFITAGVTTETYSNTTFFIKGGAELDLIIKKRFGLNLKIAGTYHPSEYYKYDETTYSLIHPSVSEMRVDINPLLTITAYGKKFNSSFVEPAIGFNFVQFIAGDFTKTFLGPSGGLRFGRHLSKDISLTGEGIISYNLISTDNKAVTGTPKIDGIVNLYLNIPVKKQTLTVGGTFEIMGYPNTILVYGNTRQSLNRNIRTYFGTFIGIGF